MSESLVGFLSDPTTLMALGAVAVGTALYLSSSSPPIKPPVPLDSQCMEIPVRAPTNLSQDTYSCLLTTAPVAEVLWVCSGCLEGRGLFFV